MTWLTTKYLQQNSTSMGATVCLCWIEFPEINSSQAMVIASKFTTSTLEIKLVHPEETSFPGHESWSQHSGFMTCPKFGMRFPSILEKDAPAQSNCSRADTSIGFPVAEMLPEAAMSFVKVLKVSAKGHRMPKFHVQQWRPFIVLNTRCTSYRFCTTPVTTRRLTDCWVAGCCGYRHGTMCTRHHLIIFVDTANVYHVGLFCWTWVGTVTILLLLGNPCEYRAFFRTTIQQDEGTDHRLQRPSWNHRGVEILEAKIHKESPRTANQCPAMVERKLCIHMDFCETHFWPIWPALPL